MQVLALDTSTEYCSVALWQHGVVIERCDLVGQRHSELLMEMVDLLLRDADVKLAQLDGIAFGMGPGSFTGVRIACGSTQGLALGANLPVTGVCTLQALAEASGNSHVVAVLDARMGELYLAAYEKREREWISVIEPCLCRPEDAPILPGVDWSGVGSGFLSHREALVRRYAGQLKGIDGSAIPRAAAIAVLGAARFTIGQGVDASAALPLYLRDRVALKTFERAQR